MIAIRCKLCPGPAKHPNAELPLCHACAQAIDRRRDRTAAELDALELAERKAFRQAMAHATRKLTNLRRTQLARTGVPPAAPFPTVEGTEAPA